MSYTSEIYAEILKSKKYNNQEKSRLARRLQMNNNAVIIYAVDKSSFLFEVYIEIEEDPAKFVFPRWKGVEIGSAVFTEYSDDLNHYIYLKQSNKSERYIFEIIVEDLRISIEKLNNLTTIVECFSNLLTKWRNFFLLEKDIQLSKERELGLLGELSLLEQLIKIYGNIAISFWVGCNDETHDFYINGDAIEVKTTALKSPYRVNISSEYQLDTQDVLNNLYLQFFAFRKSEIDGFTLSEMVHKLELLLESDDLYLQQFYQKIEQYGYLISCSELYKTGYFVRESNLFKVGENFPRIERSKVDAGINNVSYSISIDMCQKFLVIEGIKILMKGDALNVI